MPPSGHAKQCCSMSVINAPKKRNPKSISIPCAPFAAKHCPLPDPAQFMPLPTGHGSIQPLDASPESAMPDSCPRDECPHPCHAAVVHHHRILPPSKSPHKQPPPKFPMPLTQPSCPHQFHAAIAHHSPSQDPCRRHLVDWWRRRCMKIQSY